jgi:hypothetical protein
MAVRRSRTALASLGKLWCRAMHDDVGWPAQGHYRCRRCNRVYEIPWEDSGAGAAPELAEREAVKPSPSRTATSHAPSVICPQ